MSLKKRLCSFALALSMLAVSIPAFAADTTPETLEVTQSALTSGEVTREKSASKMIYNSIELGMSISGQCAKIGDTVRFHTIEYNLGATGQRYMVEISYGGKVIKSAALTFDSESGIFDNILTWGPTTGRAAGTYTIAVYTQYYSSGSWVTIDDSYQSMKFQLVKNAVALKSLYLTNASGKTVTAVTYDPTSDDFEDSYSYLVRFNPTNTTSSRDITVTSSDTSVAEVEDYAGVIYVYPAGYGKATVTVTVDGKSTTLLVHIPDPDSTRVQDIFRDVDDGAWYVDYVQHAYDNGIMSGTGTYTFEPNATVSRTQIVQMLYNMAGRPAVSGKMPFTDVKSGAWYYDAILWASQNNVVSGYTDGRFGVNDSVTREALVQILYNRAGKPAVSGSLSRFADAGSISSWAKKAVLWASNNKIVSGVSSGGKLYFQPKAGATRAQAAVMLKNYIELS